MRIPIPQEPDPPDQIGARHDSLTQSHMAEDKLIRDWDAGFLKKFVIFLIATFVIFMLPDRKPLTALLPVFILLGSGLALGCLSMISVTFPMEYRRAAVEKTGSWLEENYPEATAFNYFKTVADNKLLRCRIELSLRLFPFLCAGGCTIASAAIFYMKSNPILAFLVGSFGSMFLILITFLVTKSAKKRQLIFSRKTNHFLTNN